MRGKGQNPPEGCWRLGLALAVWVHVCMKWSASERRDRFSTLPHLTSALEQHDMETADWLQGCWFEQICYVAQILRTLWLFSITLKGKERHFYPKLTVKGTTLALWLSWDLNPQPSRHECQIFPNELPLHDKCFGNKPRNDTFSRMI